MPALVRDRATRVAAMCAAAGPIAAGSAHARPAPEPPRSHAVIPEQTAGGYRCGTCLLAIAPADYTTGPAWRHAGPGEA